MNCPGIAQKSSRTGLGMKTSRVVRIRVTYNIEDLPDAHRIHTHLFESLAQDYTKTDQNPMYFHFAQQRISASFLTL